MLHLLDGAADKDCLQAKDREMLLPSFKKFCGFLLLGQNLVQDVNLHVIMPYLEFLVSNGVSVHVIANNVAAKNLLCMVLIMWSWIKYFVKAMRINRPLSVPKRNVMSLKQLIELEHLSYTLSSGKLYKAVFLIALFGF